MRIGVFVCHCGDNIAGVIDISKVTEYFQHYRNVVYVEDKTYTCSAEGLENIRKAIRKHTLDRIVIAACTPRTHEAIFRSVINEAGLNQYLFEFVNIREQCSWVHMNEPEIATKKAIELIRMGIAKAELLKPLEERDVGVEKSTLIIGAGIAGMTAALNLSKLGFKVNLVEKEAKIGGMLKDHTLLFPTNQEASELLRLCTEEIDRQENIKLMCSSTLKKVEGFVGNFDVTIDEQGEEVALRVGTIIVATGAVEFEPEGIYGYGKYKNVITQSQFEKIIKSKKMKTMKNVVMIQCLGREIYCSKTCCTNALKNAIFIKERNPKSNVYVLYVDMQTPGPTFENYYMKAKDKGVRFVRCDIERFPKVMQRNERLHVKVYDKILQEEIKIPCDLVVLPTRTAQCQKAFELSKILRVPLDDADFFLERHIKLRPAEFSTDGIYLCGTAHTPKNIHDSVINALGAVAQAAIPMLKGKIKTEAITVNIDDNVCCRCRICEAVCPFGAIKFDEAKQVMIVNDIKCKGCGACVAACPSRALNQNHFEDNEIIAMIHLLSEADLYE